MSDALVLVLLYGFGVLLLLAEIFIPSYGILTVVGLGLLVAGIMQTFQHSGRDAGIIAVVACAVFVPTLSVLAIKYWKRTPFGKLIAPPNPVLTTDDTTVPVEQINALIGAAGRSVSTLRPVGICEFDGHRVSCVAQFGMIEPGVEVQGIGISGTNLSVAEKKA